MSHFKIVSYNIVASFQNLEEKDQTPDKRHSWAFRHTYVKEAIARNDPDIICLQEMSQEQTFELAVHFKTDYKSYFLSQCPSDIEAGIIAHGEEVKEWIGKYVGTALTGIFVKKDIQVTEQGRFWFNENPLEVPTSKDRGNIDKGFGNMNTPRAVHWVKLLRNEHEIYIFNSHYPLSGNIKTRDDCAALERRMINEITNGGQFVSVGDRNFIDDPTGDIDPYKTLTKDLFDPFRNERFSKFYNKLTTTWLGFSYDKIQTKLKENRDVVDSNKKLDVPITNMTMDGILIDAASIDPEGKKLRDVDENFQYEEQNSGRYFASDHALVALKVCSNPNQDLVMNRLRPLYAGHELEKDIEEELLFMKSYERYANGGNFLQFLDKKVTGLGEKSLYFPYLLNYLHHRCVRMYLVYVGKMENVHKYVSVRIYEGNYSDFNIEDGKMTNEILDEGPSVARYEWYPEDKEYIDNWVNKNNPGEKYDRYYIYDIVLTIRKWAEVDEEGYQKIGKHDWVKVIDSNFFFKYRENEDEKYVIYNDRDYDFEPDW